MKFSYLILTIFLSTIAVGRVHAVEPKAVEEVKGLTALLSDKYPGVLENRTPLHAAEADLDIPPDGVNEVILGIEGPYFCGSRGCLLSVSRREPDGSLLEILQRISYEVELRGGFASGIVALADDLRRNAETYGIEGKTSGAVARTRAMPVEETVEPYTGPCRDGQRWLTKSDLGESKSAIAIFTYCEADNDDILVMQCKEGTGEITAWTFIDVDGGYSPGNNMPVLFMIDERLPFPTGGKMSISEMFGYEITMVFDRYNGLLDALAAGSTATISLAGIEKRIHLSGSADAIRTFLNACPDTR